MGGPFKIDNIGADEPWHGYKTKFELLLPYLESKHDEDIVAFMDGTDIFWGGCEMSDFKRYWVKFLHSILDF